MKTKLIILLIAFVISGSVANYAQTKNDNLPPPADKKEKPSESVELVEYVFVLEIDINSDIRLTVQDTEELDNIGSISNAEMLIGFFSILNNTENSKTTSRNLSPSRPIEK